MITDQLTPEPIIVQKRAIDVTPYYHGIWCSIAGGEPFVNEIVHRKWSDNGARIWFGLDSHNFLSATPDEMIEVVEMQMARPRSMLDRAAARDLRDMAAKPIQVTCPHCNGTGKTWQRPTSNPLTD